ncbi:MAG: hypothetical protein FJZ01_27855 [Candidatus Sericytochromatia bacterium]|nr:hypothetical protein [Candidatus Tanganyikabacteria bacterium]
MSVPLVKSLLAAILAATVSGCAADFLSLFPGARPPAAAPFKPKLGTLEFRSVSAETSKKLELLNATFGSTSSQGSAVAKDAAAPASATAGRSSGETATATKDMVATGVPLSIYGYSSYFSGPFGPMKLESVTEATAPGAAGGLAAVLQAVIAPVIADWAPDAGLIYSNVLLDADGEPARGSESFPGEFGWRIAYTAPSLHEALYFLVAADKTTVVRLRWAPVVIDPKQVAWDARAAVDRVKAAVADPGFKSEEERLGKEGFFFADETNPIATLPIAGSSGGVAKAESGVAAPAVMPEKPPEDSQKPRYRWDYTDEPIFALEPGGTWRANLQVIGKYLAWELSYGANASRPEVTPLLAPARDAVASDATTTEEPRPYTYTDTSAYAIVDARTGTILRLRRPHKFTGTPIKL